MWKFRNAPFSLRGITKLTSLLIGYVRIAVGILGGSIALILLYLLFRPADHCSLFGGHFHMFSHPKVDCPIGRNQLAEIAYVPELSIPILMAVALVMFVKLRAKRKNW